MGIRIHRAMGYGMPITKLVELYKGPLDKSSKGDHAVTNGLYELFNNTPKDHESFHVSAEAQKLSFNNKENADKMATSAIMEKNLLSETYTEGGRKSVSREGSPSDLFSLIGYDDYTDIIFYPALHSKKCWFRYDDDMDYAFEQWRGENLTRENNLGIRDFVKYLPYGHYPYGNYIMTKEGRHHEWLHFSEMQKRPDLVPSIPTEIRWYLKKLGVFDDQDINQLRPALAQWWS